MGILQKISKLIFCFKRAHSLKDFFKIINRTKQYNSLYRDGGTNNAPTNSAEKFTLNIGGKKTHLSMRLPNGDLSIFYEVFYSKVYSIPKKYLPKSVERILDLGANIGCSTLYFHEQFPNAKIVAVEASKSNYLVLEKNLEFNKNITPIHAAINDKEGLVQIVDTEFAYNSKISANPNEGYEVKAITVDKIMSQENWTSIDLLKIDIEGAEKALLQNNNSWLQHVKCIIMEIHEPFTIDDVARIVVPFGYEILRPRINDTSMLLLINSKL